MAPGLHLSSLAEEVQTPPKTTLPSKSAGTSLPSAGPGEKVLDPSTITQDFDELRFEAAALQQLKTSVDSPASSLSTNLISSPYNNPGHYLDLTTLSTADLIFAKALAAVKPLRADYATAPYTLALDFPTVLALVRSLSAQADFSWEPHSFYVVIFRSQLKASIDSDLLYQLDYESHREACESGGLLKYWFGKPDGERRNLATCFWRSREDAYKGGLGPWHKKARAAGGKMYESIVFSTHRFTILKDAEDFTFEDWEG